MKKIINLLKHLLLFVLMNILALVLLGVYDALIDNTFDFQRIDQFFYGIIKFLPFALAFTAIPYVVAIISIKKNNPPPLRDYIIGGSITPIIPCLLLLLVAIPSKNTSLILMVLCFVLTGAFCGLVYGLLDKKLHFPPKPAINGGNHD